METCKKCKDKGEGKPRTVRQLMSSRKAIPVVLGFIGVTRAVQRAQRQEQEMEKQEKKRDEAWCLTEDRVEGDEEGGMASEREKMRRGRE